MSDEFPSGAEIPFEGSHRRKRGPYGTNEGDIWLAEGSPIQEMLDADGEGAKLVHELIRQEAGDVQEVVYTTTSPEIIEEARRGLESYIAEQASRN